MSVLGLLFTRNVSLETWVRTGLLDREKMIYESEIEQGLYEEIIWFTYGVQDTAVYHRLVQEGRINPQIKVIAMPRVFIGRLGYDIYSLFMPFIQRKYFKKLDIIKSNQMDGAWTGLVVKKMYHIPFYFRTGYTNTLFYKKESKKEDWNYKKFAWLEGVLYRKCDMATVTSKNDKDYICNSYGIEKNKITVLPNYVDLNRFYDRNLGKRKERIVFVGRLSEQKNLYHTIEAIKNIGIGMDIYGTGSLLHELLKLVEHMDVDVKFNGVVANDKLPDILNEYKYYILASNYEGMPKTLLEAMACGNLCIGTNVEGINEIIIDEENGFLAKGTTAAEIQDAISRAMKDREYIEKCEKAKMLIQKKFSLQSIVNKEYELCSPMLRDYISIV